jgi:hypothetical protein
MGWMGGKERVLKAAVRRDRSTLVPWEVVARPGEEDVPPFRILDMLYNLFFQ